MTQEAFDFFANEHGLILMESEYDSIQCVVNADLCREIIVWKNSYSSANAQLAEARAMVAELRKTLEPFSLAFERSGKEVFDSFANNPRMVEINDQNQILPRGTNMGHYRRAYEALHG